MSSAHLNAALRQFLRQAQRLRLLSPRRYGRKGARPGQPGYARNGWRRCLRSASRCWRRTPEPLAPTARLTVLIPASPMVFLHWPAVGEDSTVELPA